MEETPPANRNDPAGEEWLVSRGLRKVADGSALPSLGAASAAAEAAAQAAINNRTPNSVVAVDGLLTIPLFLSLGTERIRQPAYHQR